MLENMDDIWNIVMLTRTPLTLLIIHHLMGGGGGVNTPSLSPLLVIVENKLEFFSRLAIAPENLW